MKIVSWNCGGWQCGGFTIDKYNEMKSYQPEILLIQECTKKEFDSVSIAINEERRKLLYLMEDISKEKTGNLDCSKLQHWHGDDVEKSNKGMAIFSTMCMYNIELVTNFNSNFRYIIPYKISFVVPNFEKIEYTLLSIWTKAPSDGSQNYQKTIFEALDYYDFNTPIILAGDFNTGGNKKNIHRYEELKTRLEKYGLKNCAENTDCEYEPTSFHDKTNDYFTNDFCFIPKSFNVYEFYVEKMNNQKRWRNLSDHCPIIADFGESTKEELEEIKMALK